MSDNKAEKEQKVEQAADMADPLQRLVSDFEYIICFDSELYHYVIIKDFEIAKNRYSDCQTYRKDWTLCGVPGFRKPGKWHGGMPYPLITTEKSDRYRICKTCERLFLKYSR